MSLSVEIKVVFHRGALVHELIQVEPDMISWLRRKHGLLRAIPIYWANFGTEMNPSIEYWPEEDESEGSP